jgi:hypothetical protein
MVGKRLPWRGNHASLPNNKQGSLRCLNLLMKRLHRDGRTTEYDDIIREQLDEGIVERAPEPPGNREFYIPHKAVVKESAESTKNTLGGSNMSNSETVQHYITSELKWPSTCRKTPQPAGKPPKVCSNAGDQSKESTRLICLRTRRLQESWWSEYMLRHCTGRWFNHGHIERRLLGI